MRSIKGISRRVRRLRTGDGFVVADAGGGSFTWPKYATSRKIPSGKTLGAAYLAVW
jgi:hypothetical protein